MMISHKSFPNNNSQFCCLYFHSPVSGDQSSDPDLLRHPRHLPSGRSVQNVHLVRQGAREAIKEERPRSLRFLYIPEAFLRDIFYVGSVFCTSVAGKYWSDSFLPTFFNVQDVPKRTDDNTITCLKHSVKLDINSITLPLEWLNIYD